MEVYKENPFYLHSNGDTPTLEGSATIISGDNDYVVGDFPRIAKLSVQGLHVLAHSVWTIDKIKGGIIKINTQEFCERVYGGFDETLRTRVRRGIKNLVLNAVIAYSEDKDVYWINPQVIWR